MNLTGIQRLIVRLMFCVLFPHLLVGADTSDIENTVRQLEKERKQLDETIWA